VASATIQYTGRALCRFCYPFGKDFDPARHSNLADLKLDKNAKGWTPSKAAEYSEKLRKGA